MTENVGRDPDGGDLDEDVHCHQVKLFSQDLILSTQRISRGRDRILSTQRIGEGDHHRMFIYDMMTW